MIACAAPGFWDIAVVVLGIAVPIAVVALVVMFLFVCIGG